MTVHDDETIPVSIGIVGCGRVTTSIHLPAIRSVPGAEVVALADANPAVINNMAARSLVQKCVTDYRALLDDSTIDAIGICVPARFHADVALDALDAGKHVFVEKPLALTPRDCDRLINRAADTSRKVMVGFNMRWHRLARQARSMIEEGLIGKLEVMNSVRTSCSNAVPDWRKQRNTGGSVFLEMAIHHFDLWRFMLGDEVKEINALSRSGSWEDESAVVTARLRGGALASGAFAERSNQNNRIELFGRSGSISVAFYQFDGLKISDTSKVPGSVQERSKNMKNFIKEIPRALVGSKRGGEWQRSYIEQFKHFVQAIRTDKPIECGLQDGKRALAIALAAMQSTDTGSKVSIAQE